MNIKELSKEVKNFEKFWVDPDYGEIYIVTDLHEATAREICSCRGWDWRAESQQRIYSAEDFIMMIKGFVKFSNYSSLRYVAMSRNFSRDREILDKAYLLADLFNLRVEIY